MSDRSIHIDLQGLQSALHEIEGLPRRIDGVLRRHSVLKQIGTVMAASAEKTITVGGRPEPYKPLAASTLAARAKKGKGSSKPLVFLGTLRNSLDYDVDGGQLYLSSVGYLKYHQFDHDRKNPDTFPARPVWGVQPEDREEIVDIVIDELKKST
jgi:phage virion morphogenesis protein